MPEFNAFITKDEFADFLCVALTNDYRLQLVKDLTKPIPEYCCTDTDIQAALNSGQYSYLLENSAFTRYPVMLRSFEKDGRKYWYPRAKEGGPVIEVHFWAPFEKDSQKVVPSSLFAYDNKVINPGSGEIENAGEEVRDAYSLLVKKLRKDSHSVKSPQKKVTAVVSPGVASMLESGWRLASPFSEI